MFHNFNEIEQINSINAYLYFEIECERKILSKHVPD